MKPKPLAARNAAFVLAVQEHRENFPWQTRRINPTDHAQPWAAWLMFRQQMGLGTAVMKHIERQHSYDPSSDSGFVVPTRWPTDFSPEFQYKLAS